MTILFENHLGGVYTTDDEDYSPSYCEICGDCDWKLGEFETKEELTELMEDYNQEYIDEIWGEDGAE